MNQEYFGDSYDIVKRFFVENLIKMNYSVVVDPRFTDEWNEAKLKEYYKLLKAKPVHNKSRKKSALLVDPDTGVARKKKTKRHITVDYLVEQLEHHDIVFSFDQSFSWSKYSLKEMREKLVLLKKSRCFGFYYDSHARFLFAAKNLKPLKEVYKQLRSSGLPAHRFIGKNIGN